MKELLTLKADPPAARASRSEMERLVMHLDAAYRLARWWERMIASGSRSARAELLARIRALLRRARETTQNRAFEDIEVDVTRRIVTKGGMEVKLTPLEYNLLAYFLEHPGWVVMREMVLNSVGGYEFCPNTRTVDAHVVRLRRSWNLINAAAPCMESAIVLCLKMKSRVFDGRREKDKRRIPRGFSRGARWA